MATIGLIGGSGLEKLNLFKNPEEISYENSLWRSQFNISER